MEDKITLLEELLKEKNTEIDLWKAHSRKWENRSKKNYQEIRRLENELIHHIKLAGELK